MDLRLIFGANLRRLRRAKGLSQDRLAERAEVDRTFISRIETSLMYPGLEAIGKLADALEANPGELLKLPRKRKKRGRRSAGWYRRAEVATPPCVKVRR